MKGVTSAVRATRKVGRKCKSPGCAKAVVICAGCNRRFCRHMAQSLGWYDVDTGEQRQKVDLPELVQRRERLIPLGMCTKCKVGAGAATWREGLAAIAVTARELSL